MAQIGSEIFNPQTGQRMRFVQTRQSSAGKRLELACISPPSPEDDSDHVHPYQESSFEVHRGKLGVRVNALERTVGPGEQMVIPPRASHCFWVEGNEEAHDTAAFEPALNIEDFFETYFALAREGKLNAHGLPNLLMIAVMGQTFWQEIRFTQPPFWIQRILYATLAPLGGCSDTVQPSISSNSAYSPSQAKECIYVSHRPNLNPAL